jgi:hypothetical protein
VIAHGEQLGIAFGVDEAAHGEQRAVGHAPQNVGRAGLDVLRIPVLNAA